MVSHPLLDRLLRRAGFVAGTPTDPAAWEGLMSSLAIAFTTADQDRRMLERSMEISSQEMQGLYYEIERRSESELERARRAAEAASQAKSMFLANMSHELRTPLNAVIGLADLLLVEGADPLSPMQTRYVEAIVESGRHLLAMVNDVLDLARIEVGRQELDVKRIHAAAEVSAVVLLLSPLAAGRGVELHTVVPPELGLVADPLRLRQILLNLVGNAIKFTDRGGRVDVGVARRGDHVEIAIADTGIGIARQDMVRLFRPFEQLALPSGDRPPGTGLGLALTKRLVDLHGGTIDVTSELGVGSTFTLTFTASEEP